MAVQAPALQRAGSPQLCASRLSGAWIGRGSRIWMVDMNVETCILAAKLYLSNATSAAANGQGQFGERSANRNADRCCTGSRSTRLTTLSPPTAALLPTVTSLCGAHEAAASIDRPGMLRLGCTHPQATPWLRQRCRPLPSRLRVGMSYTASMLFILACVAIGTPAAVAACIWIDRDPQRKPRS